MSNSKQPIIKYLAEYEANNAYCFAYVNGILTGNNRKHRIGPTITGVNATPFLQKGDNLISIRAASAKAFDNIKELDKDAFCKLALSGNGPDDKIEMTSVVITPDDKMLPTGAKTPSYPARHRTGEIQEGQVTRSALYEVKRTIHIEHIPEWAWTKATPLENTKENYIRLQNAYHNVYELLAEGNLKKLKEMTALAMKEWAEADNGDPDFFFDSLGIESHIADGYTVEKADWGKYKLKSYANGRLLQLVKGKKSPLVLVKEDKYFSYNPYFSYINGKMVITR